MTKLIAVIDDEAEMEFIYLLLLDKLLQDHLVKLAFFSEITPFLHWIDTNKPDLIMTDINMPVMTGLEVIRKIRSAGHCAPAYFVSGYDEKDYRTEMGKLGVCRFLAKPLNPHEVVTHLSSDLGLVAAKV